MAKYNVNIFENNSLDKATAKKDQEAAYQNYLNKGNPMVPKKATSAQQTKEIASQLSDFDAQRSVQPVPEGQTAAESFNPGMRTQKIKLGAGAYQAKDGTTISLGDMEVLANQASGRVDSPFNELDIDNLSDADREATLRSYYDVEGAKQNSVPGLDSFDFENNTKEQMGFNRGLNRQLDPNFNPATEGNNLVDMLSTSRTALGGLAGTVPEVYKRQDIDPVTYKNKFTTIQDNTNRFKKRFDGLLAKDIAEQTPADIQALTQMLANNNVSSRSLTELLYNKIAPASQLMEGNSPNGLAGAMLLSALQYYADAQVATDRRIAVLDRYPKDQKDLDSWTVDDRQAFQNLSNEIYNEEMAGQKSIGYLVAQAGNMQLSGPEMSLLSEISKKVMIDEFGAEMFIKTPTVLGERIMLTENMARWVNEDRNMMMYLLNQPIKLPRVGAAGRIPLSEGRLDHRLKGIVNKMRPWLENKDIDTETHEELHKLALHVLNDTPHTTLNTQSRLHAMLMGFNSQTGEYENNSTSALYDHKEYKNIKYEGSQGSRTKQVEKYDVGTDSVKQIFDSSDTEKDNLTQLNLKSAVQYIGNTIRFNHFVGSNFRFYHEASVLNPTDHSARAFLGAGSYVKYKTGSAKQMMMLKAGIMTMVEQKVPGTQVKYSQTRFQDRAAAFDENILGWMNKFGDIVEAFEVLDNPNTPPQVEVEMTRELQNPESPLSQAATDLLTFGQEHNGYYSTNAVIEAVKLQLAIEKGNKIYKSNFMFEVDGTSNGLSLNALFIAEMEVLAMTGITPFILDQTTGYNYPDQYDANGNLVTDSTALNMLTAPKPYEMLTQIAVGMLDRAAAPAKRRLLDIATRSNILSDKSSKGQITKGMYGSGQDASANTVLELYLDTLGTKEFSGIEEELFDAGYGQRSEIIRDLAKVNWASLVKITGDLRDFGNVQQQFLTKIIEQYKNSDTLPAPATILDSGYIMRHGEPVQTIHGPELALPAGLPGTDNRIFRQNQNMIDPEGSKRDKTTGKRMGYLSAVTGGPVKMTHHVDAYMVLNQALRAWTENPGAADGVMGGVLLQMYDGFFGAPMYADWMDKTLNEEFLNLGYKVNNISALIDSAEAQGYNLKADGMQALISKMLGYQGKGRKFLKELTKQGISGNQFQIGDGARIVGVNLNANESIKSFDFDNSLERLIPRGSIKAKHMSSKGNPSLRRTYAKPKGTTEKEIAEKEAGKQQRIRDRQEINEKSSQQIKLDGYNSKKPRFNTNDRIIYNQIGGEKIKAVIVRLATNNPDGIMYQIQSDAGKQYMVSQNLISKP